MRTLGRAVSALRLSAHPDLPDAPGPRDERRPHASAVAPGRRCRCRGSGRADAWRPAARGRCRRPRVNHVWAYDFVFDTCANGQTLKCLTVVDELTRECLAIDVAGGIRSGPRDRGADAARQRPRRPAVSALGQRPGVRRARRSCAGSQTAQIDTALIDPGKPWQNGDRRIVQRQVPRRASLAAVVSQSRRCEGRHRAVAPALQRGPAALEPRVSDARWNSKRPVLATITEGRSPAKPARADHKRTEPKDDS